MEYCIYLLGSIYIFFNIIQFYSSNFKHFISNINNNNVKNNSITINNSFNNSISFEQRSYKTLTHNNSSSYISFDETIELKNKLSKEIEANKMLYNKYSALYNEVNELKEENNSLKKYLREKTNENKNLQSQLRIMMDDFEFNDIEELKQNNKELNNII